MPRMHGRSALKVVSFIALVCVLYSIWNSNLFFQGTEPKVVTVPRVKKIEDRSMQTTEALASHVAEYHPLNIPPYLSEHLPNHFKHDSCRRLPSDRLSPVCPFCKKFDMSSVTIYWDSYEKAKAWLGGSVEKHFEESKNCSLPFNTKCIMNYDNPSSDAVVKFYTVIEDSRTTRACFPQIIISLNSEAEFPGSDHGYSPFVEIAADYHLTSEIKLLYSCWNIGYLLQAPSPNPKERSGIAMFVSNCKNKERIAYLEQLMKHIKIDSYGSCLHNTDKMADRDYDRLKPAYQGGWVEEMIRVSTKYRMVITYENSYSSEYFSEKVFCALRAGAIPVYRGPSEIYEQIPGDNTIINIDEYATPAGLALYLKRVLQDDQLFLRHATFDQKKLRSYYKNVCVEANQPVGCQMCEHAYRLKLASYKEGGRPCGCPL